MVMSPIFIVIRLTSTIFPSAGGASTCAPRRRAVCSESPGDTKVHAIFAESGLNGCTWPTKERAALGNCILQSVRIPDVQLELVGESITNPGGDVMLHNGRETND